MTGEPFDILVIGGGINGCGIARDAVGRGFSVLLAEMNDLASGTSSASTKLIHGGLRYLEHYEFRLVRESLLEREVLWAMAPHIIWPLRFVLPHHRDLRPAWLLRAGLFVYDHLGGRKLLPPTRVVDLASDPIGAPLAAGYRRGFEYSDAWVQDARLVVLNARDAEARGAVIRTRTAVSRLRREGGGFIASLEDRRGGGAMEVRVRLVVNAAGPWVDSVIDRVCGEGRQRNVRLVQGSHIVVPRLYDHDRCFIFQNADGRIVFTIPYETGFTLIGTTDREYSGDPGEAAISEEEIAYLCRAASEYFRDPVRREDVVWSYSGVRPLYADLASRAQEATRDYILKTDGDAARGARIDIFGGKITTYRRLAEAALEKVEAALGRRGARWTAGAPLPGGKFPVSGFEALVADLRAGAPGIAEATLRRLARNYGTDAHEILADGSIGRIIGADLGENELRFLVNREYAVEVEDVLWRRSKLGLHFSTAETAELQAALDHLLLHAVASAVPDKQPVLREGWNR